MFRGPAELLTLPCAELPPEAPKEARVASRARSHGLKEKGHQQTIGRRRPWLKRVGDVLVNLSGPRVPRDQRTLDRTKHVAPFRAPNGGEGGAGGERGDGVGLVLPLDPSPGLREVRAQGLPCARPLGGAEHVDKVQVATSGSSGSQWCRRRVG